MPDPSTPQVLLSVAGTDSGGAAGVAADLATFAALGAHGAVVVTAVTAQDTTGVHRVHQVPVEVVRAQVEAVLGDLPVAGVKTGMLGSAAVLALVAEYFGDGSVPLVVDPVLAASTGAGLAGAAVLTGYRELLIPAATVVTPNVPEARILLGSEASPDQLAAALADLGPAAVVTGGVDRGTCTDWVALPGTRPVPLTHDAVVTGNDHGTGCTFSAALAVHLAAGDELVPAVRRAAALTVRQLDLSRSWDLGRGRGPIAHTQPDHHRNTRTPFTDIQLAHNPGDNA